MKITRKTLKIHVTEREKLTELFNLLNSSEFLTVPTEYYNLEYNIKYLS